ncbi:MAG TPA: hypothetical protein VHO69_03575 [Phototrophicaceae bacterium]|nr:hypothetical protein [Phototrophicaceae bacterium]
MSHLGAAPGTAAGAAAILGLPPARQARPDPDFHKTKEVVIQHSQAVLSLEDPAT